MKSLEQLYNERSTHATTIETAKAALAAVDAEILEATLPRITALYTLTGKQHGTVSLDAGTFVAKGDISKKVEWNSGVLMSVASKMSWDRATEIFKIDFAVPEKTYKTLEPELRAEIDKARTTKYGDVKVTLEKKEA